MKQLPELIAAGFSGIWIETVENDEAEREVNIIATDKQLDVCRWDATLGDPLDAMSKPLADKTMYIYVNLHLFFGNPFLIQATFNRIIEGKSQNSSVIVLTPHSTIPLELQKHFVVVEHELPNEDVLAEIANDIEDKEKSWTNGMVPIQAAAGLTRYEAESAFALSMVRHNHLQPDTVWELKQGMVKKSGVLTLHKNGDSFDKLGGMNGLKDFCLKALKGTKGASQARGVLLLGVPGAGKSAFAKALGHETHRPVLLLELGSLMGSLVGETEANVRKALRVADAMAPCILFADEIEKALSGSTSEHQGDSGVSARMLGTLLTWLQDHTSDVFFIGTCNDASKLPAPFTRAERFDATWFLDVPSPEVRNQIWDLYTDIYDTTDNGKRPCIVPTASDDNWTGAEIKACCRLASMLNIPLTAASKYVIPVAITAAEQIEKMKAWATNRCLDAETGTVYRPVTAAKPRRKLV